MPGGVINSLSNLVNKTKQPHYFTLMMFAIIFLVIYSGRIFGFNNKDSNISSLSSSESKFHLITGSIIMVILVGIIIITIANPLNAGGKIIKNFDSILNSTSSKNIITLFSLIFFVIFVYEVAEFDNNNPHGITDKLLMGNNNFLSNRSAGILLIIVFSLFTGYTISVTSSN